MTKLEKLSIQGIRSFSPKEKNVIEFQTPLTIILGANGTGKTTIIECLKFVTIGDMPPNSRGGAFVYDPKLAKEIDVKAEVKLKFRTERNDVLTCCRSLQSTLKKFKGEQKTLECTLSKHVDNNDLIICSKIADVDRQVPEYLGVSHSILDNVIFCHQDESVWPIGDPTVMKKKLDDIFSSTKYNKALLGMKASKKEINSDLKLKSQQLNFLLKEKMKREEIIKNIKFYSEEVEKKNERIKVFGIEIEKSTAKLSKMQSDLKLYEKLENNCKILSEEMKNCKNFIKNFSIEVLSFDDRKKDKNQKNIHKKNIENLNESKNNTISQLKQKEENLLTLSACNIELEFSIVESIRRKIIDQEIKNEKLIKLKNDLNINLENLKKERIKFTNDLIKKLNCEENEIVEKSRLILDQLEQKVKLKALDLINERENLIIKKTEQKNTQHKLKDANFFIEKHKNLKIIENFDFTEIIVDLERQLELEVSFYELQESLNTKQNQLNDAFRNSNSHYKRNHLMDSIEKVKKCIDEVPKDFKFDIKEACSTKESISLELKELMEKNQRNLAINDQRSKNNFTLINEIHALCKEYKILPEMPIENNTENTVNFTKDQNSMISEFIECENTVNLTKDQNSMISEFIECENTVNFTKNQNPMIYQLISSNRSNLSSDEISLIKNEFPKKCLELKELRSLHQQNEALEAVRNNKLAALSATKVYENFIKISEDKHHCPLCIRKLDENSKEEFCKKLKNVILKIPRKTDELTAKEEELINEIKEIELHNSEITKMNTTRQRITENLNCLALYEYQFNLKIKELEDKKIKIEQNIEKYKESSQLIKTYELNLASLTKELTSIPVQIDILKLEKEVKEFKDTITIKKKDLLEYNKRIKDSELKKKMIEQELENRKNIETRDKLIKETSNLQENDLSTLEIKVIKLEKEMEKLNSDFIKAKLEIAMWRKRLNEISEQIGSNEQEISEVEMKIIENNSTRPHAYIDNNEQFSHTNTINSNVHTNTINNNAHTNKINSNAHTNGINNNSNVINNNSNAINNNSNAINSNAINNNVIKFNNQVLSFDDIKDKTKYESIRQSVISHKNSIIDISKEIDQIRHSIRILDENIKLVNYKDRLASIDEELNKFDAESFKDLKNASELLETKRTKLLSSESVLIGELRQIVHTIKTLNAELEQHKEANKNFFTCSIEIKVLEMSLEDLDKCINGLDKAIVDFHSSKIEDVNRTLKELWMNTYKGNDIDFIELKAESSETRAYNYRLVMVKNGVELDMRGRSSAGQKMISSILFRIALTDSFSQGCNVFALDEPTTNLDKENIESLANTLSLIIKERKNTQFIVITHDEDFVQLLNREGTEYFYKLHRDSKGHGHIQRHSIYR